MNHLGCLAPKANWLKQKGNVLAQQLGLLVERQAPGLASLSSTLCGFLLRLQTHQTSHWHQTTSRRREAGSPCTLCIRKFLPQVPGKPTLESHRLERDYRAMPETILLAR